MENVRVAYRVMPGLQEHDGNVKIDESHPIDAIAGVTRVWVSRMSRRKGIASQMLDAARKRFLFGVTISKEDLTFSQPSESGKQLAVSFSGRPDFLVYKSDY